jgi:hypothetical protein
MAKDADDLRRKVATRWFPKADSDQRQAHSAVVPAARMLGLVILATVAFWLAVLFCAVVMVLMS